jgi:large subunit ribosomal protein L22
MISRATTRFIRISPRKTRLAADMVRGKSIDEAQAVLSSLEVRPRFYIQQTLKSAVANATSVNPDISPADLYISKIVVDGGPMFKRYRAGSMGRAMMIKHRTSHILIELDRKKEKSQVTGHKSQVKEIKRPVVKEKVKEKEKPKAKKMAVARKGK